MSFASKPLALDPRHTLRAALAVAITIGVALVASSASAQEPPPFVPPAYAIPPSVVLSGPARLTDWEEGEPIPRGYHPIRRKRTGLVVGGAVTFGTTYLLSALGGAIASDTGSDRAALLMIPVIGPFTMIGGDSGATGSFGLVLNGLTQAAGITMFAIGMAMPKTVLVRNDLAKVEVAPVPMTFGPQSGGVGLLGTF